MQRCLAFVENLTRQMDSEPVDGATADGLGDMLQRLQVVEKRLDRIESGDVQGQFLHFGCIARFSAFIKECS